MKNTSNDQIDRLLEDIALIKETINRNRPVLHQLFNIALFRWFLLVVGLGTIGFSMFILILMCHYGSFSSIPDTVRYIIYAVIAVCLVFIQIWKGRAYLASAKQINRNLTIGWALKEFYSNKISLIYISIVVLMIFFCIFFIVQKIPYFIIPTFSIGIALISICYGVILQIRYSLITGYWFFVTGICTIIFSAIPAPIAVSMTFGCGMLILSFSGFLSFKSKEED